MLFEMGTALGTATYLEYLVGGYKSKVLYHEGRASSRGRGYGDLLSGGGFSKFSIVTPDELCVALVSVRIFISFYTEWPKSQSTEYITSY